MIVPDAPLTIKYEICFELLTLDYHQPKLKRRRRGQLEASMACMVIGKTNRRMASSQCDLDSFYAIPRKDELRFSLLYNNYIKFDNKLTNLSNHF